MTGQDLLDRMELLNQELQLQSGEVDVTRGLLALNVAQDYFETLAAARPKIFGSSTGTVSTSASTETTAYPSGLLRIDRLQVLNASNLPEIELFRLQRAGGHAATRFWPLNLISTVTSGKPRAYWTNGTSIYWDPIPNGTHTVRWYGFSAASAITAGGTFAYPDIVALPLAAFGVRLMSHGVGDEANDWSSLAVETFKPVLDALTHFNRDGARGFEYTEIHTT